MDAKALAAESSIDKSPTKDEALRNAILAAELYMKAIKLASSEQDRARLRGKCKQLLSRAEEIKKKETWTPRKSKTALLKAPSSERPITKSEETILLEGSKLHGFIFPPWRSDPDDSNFNGSQLYTDPADLKLSEAQREVFAGWKRPHETFGRPPESPDQEIDHGGFSMVAANEIDLLQDITTDCSVVASLCASTARAFKWHEKLLAGMIYPYDKANLRPGVSKTGKYIFRMHFNGCFRKVVIDDRLPASNSSRSLHVIDRRNPQLLWPALVEKAYLKVRGGYDFPGSNSGTDLWVLTGWIPEQVFLHSNDIQPQQLWNRVLKSFGYGDVIITLGTGKLSQNEEQELGLAGEHDYAVLDIREVGSQRLLLVKNPWCDGMVWKSFVPVPDETSSEQSWTKDLKEALPSQSETAAGTFWMSFGDVVQNFKSLYLNWNPGLFLHRQDHHFSWTLPAIHTPGSFAHNPQYAVSSTTKGTVWILLSRHFTTSERDNIKKKPEPLAGASSALGFISLYIFEANGRRVYLSDDALHRGAFVDSPQTLARLEVLPSTPYTIVAAQHGLQFPTYSFTLSFFSRSPFAINPAIDPLPHRSTHTGAWTARTAGGNASAPSYPMNPQFSISVPSPTDITLMLETDREELAIHVKMVWSNGERVSALIARDILCGSGDYRRGCALASLTNVPPGKYTIVCSTFEAGQTGNFTLRTCSAVPCTVTRVPAEAAGRLSQRLPVLVFQHGIDRMLAPLTTARLTRLRLVARYGWGAQTARARPPLRISVECGQGPNKAVLDVSGNGQFGDAPMGVRTADLDLGPAASQTGGLWIVVERLGGTFDVDDVDVTVEVLSDSPVSVGLWGTGG